VTIVHASVTTTEKTSPDAKIATIQENGTWKVCLSKSLGDSGMGGSTPPSSVTQPPPSSSSNTSSACDSPIQSAFGVADWYMIKIEHDEASDAQNCVWNNSVPESVAQQLSGKDFTPDYSSGGETGPFVFNASDGTKVTVSVTKESDGNYYVTDVAVS
jgi:hypothetical protein